MAYSPPARQTGTAVTDADQMLPPGVPLHRLDMEVRWGDMDALGHVNNIMYFRYFEQTRIAWYEQAGFAPLGSGDTGMVIVDNHAEYLRPVHYPATMDVRMAGHSPGRSSFVAACTIVVNGVLCTRGQSKVVWIDVKSGRSTPLPEDLRAQLQGAARA